MAINVDTKDLHRVVVTCIIYKRQWFARPRYLVKKRAHIGGSPYPGKWEVVGGGLHRSDYHDRKLDNHDGWEDVLSSIVAPREVMEETNLWIGDPWFIGDFIFIRQDDVPVVGIRYAAEYAGGVVALDHEATEYTWIGAHEVNRYDLIGTIGEDIRKVDRIVSPWRFRLYDCGYSLIKRMIG